MSDNKTKPTSVPVATFLESVSETRREESRRLIDIMRSISGEEPVMWRPSIIGFGSQHYKYDTGREGDMSTLAFSPRKAKLTVYFEGFDGYKEELERLGKFTSSVSCLYINKLSDVDIEVLSDMLRQSFDNSKKESSSMTIDDYISTIPSVARPKFDELREIVKSTAPQANEVLSYGIIGYKTDDKRAKVFVSGWKDHVAMYPIPKDEALHEKLKPYIRGKGTLWFDLDSPLPKDIIKLVVESLVS